MYQRLSLLLLWLFLLLEPLRDELAKTVGSSSLDDLLTGGRLGAKGLVVARSIAHHKVDLALLAPLEAIDQIHGVALRLWRHRIVVPVETSEVHLLLVQNAQVRADLLVSVHRLSVSWALHLGLILLNAEVIVFLLL